MQEKAACVGKGIELKIVTAVRRLYTREYGQPALSAISLCYWRQKFQECETSGHNPRFGRQSISDADVARIEQTFQSQPRKSLRVPIAELESPFSEINNVLNE